MTLTLLNTKLRKIALLKLPLLSLSLIALLSGCNKLDKFPSDRIWEVDAQDNVCGEYQVLDANKLLYKHIKDWPLSKCDGVFGFSTADTPKVIRWATAAQVYVKEHCQ